MTTKEELIEARRILVRYAVRKNVNDETFKILNGLVQTLEKEISQRATYK